MNISNLRIPEDFTNHDESLMSNCDWEIDRKVESEIKGEPLFASYPAWNFFGNVWWQNEKWHCEVWTYKSYDETFSSETLEGIMSDVSEKYGRS